MSAPGGAGTSGYEEDGTEVEAEAEVGALLALSAALASRDEANVREALGMALGAADPIAVEETLLQSHLFLGYPAALNGFALWRELSGRMAGPPTPDREAWGVRGVEVCRRVYGGQYEGLRANIRRLHPDMERWMVEEGYGKVLGRPGLALAVRELCIVAILAVQDVPRQLYSHLRGARCVGASEQAVERALEAAARVSTAAARARAGETWNAVRGRAEGKQG